jgi:formyl-CoA transferase
MGISIGDALAATFACLGALTALHHRERTGRGQVVDSALYEAVLNMMESLITEFDQVGYIRERQGSILPNVAPSNVYPTKEGLDFLIAANQDTVFKRFAEAMGRPELAEDERYATHAARGANQEELDALVAEWTQGMPIDELNALMDEYGIPAGKIYRAPEMLEDMHFKARQAIVEVMHPKFGKLKMQNVAPKLSETPGSIRSPAPELGQHNEAVFKGVLGLSDSRYQELQDQGII